MEQGEIVNLSIKQLDVETKRRVEETEGVRGKLILLQTQLAGVVEEKDIMRRDVEEVGCAREERIRAAWKTRDSAVDRKNAAEVDLARARVEARTPN